MHNHRHCLEVYVVRLVTTIKGTSLELERHTHIRYLEKKGVGKGARRKGRERERESERERERERERKKEREREARILQKPLTTNSKQLYTCTSFNPRLHKFSTYPKINIW